MYRIPKNSGLVKEDGELSLNQEQQGSRCRDFFRNGRNRNRDLHFFWSDRKRKDAGLHEADPGSTGRGKQAIVLIPKLHLPIRQSGVFYAVFGDKVSVLNSRLSQGAYKSENTHGTCRETAIQRAGMEHARIWDLHQHRHWRLTVMPVTENIFW